MSVANENRVLVALLPTKSDFLIAKEQKWYRIPMKPAPPIVKKKQVKIISFYQPKVFGEEKYLIRWYGYVNKISIVKRKELFPNQPVNSKSGNEYFKIEFDNLKQLSKPIISLRPRRILFIPTTEEKFFQSKEINFLFNDSPLEDVLWNELIKNQIAAERQFYLHIGKRNFFLDFALFCRSRHINIECDGDLYHNSSQNIQYDKGRNNILESYGWSVLRFTTKDVKYEMNTTLNLITKTINQYGGLQTVSEFDKYKYIVGPNNSQYLLFD
jgi:very-short-patch-repair endonuclease